MDNLIKITENNGKKAVSARELHSFLESKRQFGNWIQNRIEKYGLIENTDYEILHFDYEGNCLINRLNKNVKSDNQHIAKIEYALSIDAAKELSMVEGNEKGKIARQYFISCEKKLKEQPKLDFSNPDTVLMIVQNWKEEQQRRIEVEQEKERLQLTTNIQSEELKKQAPKVQYFDNVMSSTGRITINTIANDLGMSAIKLNRILVEKKVQYKQNDTYVLYNQFRSSGLVQHVPYHYINDNGESKTAQHMYWTEKGRKFILDILKT